MISKFNIRNKTKKLDIDYIIINNIGGNMKMDNIREYGVKVVGIIVLGVVALWGYNKLFPAKEVTAQYSTINIMLPNGNRVIGQVGLGNGQVWIPQETLKKVLNTPIQWNKKDEILYIGKIPNAEIMSSAIGDPFNMTGSSYSSRYKKDKVMTIGGKEYSLGYSFENIDSAEFNLSKDYNVVQGIIGLQDYTSKQGGIVEVYVDNELVQSYELNPKELPKKFAVDVAGALKLSIMFKGFAYDSQINLANMYIQ